MAKHHPERSHGSVFRSTEDGSLWWLQYLGGRKFVLISHTGEEYVGVVNTMRQEALDDADWAKVTGGGDELEYVGKITGFTVEKDNV